MAETLERLALDPPLRVGPGILAETLAALEDSFALISQPVPLEHLDAALRGRATAERLVASLSRESLEALEADVPPVLTVVGIGGGVVMDAAKYVAWRRGCRLILAPSIVSGDVCVTNTIAVRDEGTVTYRGFVVASLIVIDTDLIRAAPSHFNRAGIGDIVSIHTALWDWARGAELGHAHFDPAAVEQSAAVLAGIETIAAEIRRVTPRTVEAIVRAYVRSNAICLQVGHTQSEEGSAEHYFAYCLEALTGHSFVHGQVIGLGTVLMSTLQGNDPERVRRILREAGVEWLPEPLALALERLGRPCPSSPRQPALADSLMPYAPVMGRLPVR